MTEAYLTINVTEADTIVDGDITSITVAYDGGEAKELTVGSVVDGKISAIHTIGAQAVNPTLACTVTIVYAQPGTYSVSVTLYGTV